MAWASPTHVMAVKNGWRTMKKVERRIKQPVFPDFHVSITDFHQSSDTLYTQAFNDAIRFLGFSLIRLLKALLDFSSDVMTSAYNLFSFSTSSDVNSYITQLMGFLWIPCIISLLILGIQLILNPKDRPDTSKIIQNALLIIVLVTGLPALLSTTASVTKQFVEANGSTGKNVSGTIIAEHLTDYAYLYDWKTMEFPKTLTDSNGNPIAKNKYTAPTPIILTAVIQRNGTIMKVDLLGLPLTQMEKWEFPPLPALKKSVGYARQ